MALLVLQILVGRLQAISRVDARQVEPNIGTGCHCIAQGEAGGQVAKSPPTLPQLPVEAEQQHVLWSVELLPIAHRKAIGPARIRAVGGPHHPTPGNICATHLAQVRIQRRQGQGRQLQPLVQPPPVADDG